MTEPKQELKPCKCGYYPNVFRHWNIKENRWVYWSARCKQCSAELNHFATEAEAIAAWNQYVDPIPPSERTNIMTEPKQELKPCPFCGGDGEGHCEENTFFGVHCVQCGASTGGVLDTMEAARARWNRRAVDPAPAPQWTDEPEEAGQYWVLIGQCRGITLVNVFEEEDELYVHHMGNPEMMSVSDYEECFHVHGWLYIPFPKPPLPAESEDTL